MTGLCQLWACPSLKKALSVGSNHRQVGCKWVLGLMGSLGIASGHVCVCVCVCVHTHKREGEKYQLNPLKALEAWVCTLGSFQLWVDVCHSKFPERSFLSVAPPAPLVHLHQILALGGSDD